MRRPASVLVGGLAFAWLTMAGAQTQGTGPTLTEVQQLKLRMAVQAVQLAQLRAQLVQVEFDTAQKAVGALIQSLQKNGYTLDLEKMVYVPVPRKDKDPE